MFPESTLINGPNLLQQNNRILTQAYAAPGNIDMGWQSGFACLAGNGSCNYRWRMTISCIILNNEHGSCTSLLTANNRGQVGIKYIAPLD
jgi:hypothetical protein